MLYAGSIAWVIGYDTIYAHQDREDDALIGIKSTALLFGDKTQAALAGVLRAGGDADRRVDPAVSAAAGLPLRSGLIAFAVASRLADPAASDIDDPALCLRLFKSNRDAGAIAAVLGPRSGRAVAGSAAGGASRARRPAPTAVIPRACGGSSTPRLLGSITDASGILGRPVKPGDDD